MTLPGGRAAANAIVRWVWTNDSESRETQTDGEGHFRLAGMPDADGFLAVIPPGGTGTGPAAARRSRAAGLARSRSPWGRANRSKGRVLDDAGIPIEGVSVVPFLPYPDPRFGLQIWLAERATRTDAQGRFALAGLPRSGAHFEFRRGDGRSVLPYQSLKLGGARMRSR